MPGQHKPGEVKSRMACSSKIAVFHAHQNPELDKPTFRIKKHEAIAAILRGDAVMCGRRAVQLQPKQRGSEVAISSASVSCPQKQGIVYERAAIEPYAQFLQGGLVRTEKRPEKFQITKGARVGHQ